jgi:uncharacterized membrane protein AbrB (regulator of aidB expression)
METPAYRFYDATSVLLAWLLGSPLAGVALMSPNYRRLGDREKAVTAVIIGVSLSVDYSIGPAPQAERPLRPSRFFR